MAKWFKKDLDKVESLLTEAQEILASLGETAEEKYDNYPENFQETETGERMASRIDSFEDIGSNVEDLLDDIMEVD